MRIEIYIPRRAQIAMTLTFVAIIIIVAIITH